MTQFFVYATIAPLRLKWNWDVKILIERRPYWACFTEMCKRNNMGGQYCTITHHEVQSGGKDPETGGRGIFVPIAERVVS